MSDYTQAIDFSTKDTLPSGNPAKIIFGADVDSELALISTAIASKSNKVAGGTNGNILARDAVGDLSDSGFATANIWRRNLIHNGAMTVWRRGTSFPAIATEAYGPDRWKYRKVGAMVHTLSQSTTVPTPAQAGRRFHYSLQLALTTADTSIAAGDFCTVTQQIEGFNFQAITEQAFVVSFWVRHGTTGTYCVSCRNSGSDRSFVGTFTINSVDTWELKAVTVTASPSAGTWDYTTGVGLSVSIALAVGSTFQTTAGAWQTGNFLGTSAQTNGVNTGAGNFHIAGIQVEVGAVRTPFDPVDYQDEAAICERYFRVVKSESLGSGVAGNNVGAVVPLVPPMRAAPTATANTGTNSNTGATTIDSLTAETCRYFAAVTATAAYSVSGHTTLSADL